MTTGLGTRIGDRAFLTILTLCGLAVVAIALLMAFTLGRDATEPLQRFGFLGFLTGTRWDPVSGTFGAWPFIVGTLLTSVAALLISFLPALGLAILSAEYAPKWLATIIDYIVDLLAAIPSVVLGIWGIFVLALLLRDTVYRPIYAWAAENALSTGVAG